MQWHADRGCVRHADNRFRGGPRLFDDRVRRKAVYSASSKICEYYPEGAAGWDSYIWQGGEETFSSTGLGRQRELFVGEYRILADENVGKEGKLSLTVTVRAATAAEQLYGAAEREHYLKQLKSGSLTEQRAALDKLSEMVTIPLLPERPEQDCRSDSPARKACRCRVFQGGF